MDIYSEESKRNSVYDSFLSISYNGCTNEFLNQPFTCEEIDRCIKRLRNSNAPGGDEILNEYLKLTKTCMITVYASLFNLILKTGNVPEQWTIGKIKPICKNKGDSLDPSNYRPITILSCLG